MNTARLYAQALWEYLQDTRTREAGGGSAAEQFIAFLKRRGHYKLLPVILREFEKIGSVQSVTEAGTLTCASEDEVERYRKELERYGISDTEVSVEIDENLVGGFRYEEKNTVIDGCYRKQLLNLYRELIA